MNVDVVPHVEYKDVNSAFTHRIRVFEWVNKSFKSIEEFLVNAFELYQAKLTETDTEFSLIKTVRYLSVEYFY